MEVPGPAGRQSSNTARVWLLVEKALRADGGRAAYVAEDVGAQQQQAEMMQAMQEAKVAKDAAPMLKELNRGPTE